ncbi:MAG: hypothetical protein ABH834_04930 [Candidatus Altiarchaeota archaeon]
MPGRKDEDVFEVRLSLKLASCLLLVLVLIVFAKTFLVPGKFDAPVLHMQLASVTWFLAVLWGIGASATRVLGLRLNVNPIEGFFTNAGLGLGLFPILSVIMNFAGIPLNWFVYLLLALCVPLAYASRSLERLDAKKLRKLAVSSRKNLAKSLDSLDAVMVLAAVLFASILFYVLVFGAFKYAWLEDGDPWEHAASAKYVSVFNTFSVPADMYVAHYLEPYPPAYATIMGVTHQLNTHISWTLKYFNSFIVCLGIVFFYVFVKKLSGSSQLAFYSSFFLSIVNSYSSHFIWAQALNVAIFYPAFYAFESLRDDRKWFYIAFLIPASVLVVQTTTAVMFGVFFFAYFVVKSLLKRRVQKLVFFAGLIGFMLALSFYWAPAYAKFGFLSVYSKNVVANPDASEVSLSFLTPNKKDLFNRVYSLREFVHAADPTHIPQPTGLGEVYFGLLLFSVVFLLSSPREEKFMLIVLCWFFLALIALESAALPLTLRSTRNWTYIAVFSAIICGKGLMIISAHMRNYPLSRAMVFVLIVAGVLATSGAAKYSVQTSIWPMGVAWVTDYQFQMYLGLKSMPPDTPMFSACFPDEFLIGVDKMAHPWDRELVSLREERLPYVSVQELHSILSERGFKFLIYDPSCEQRCLDMLDASMCMLKWSELQGQLTSSGLFDMVHLKEDSAIYSVK